MADRCTGHCCRAFVLHGFTLNEFKERLADGLIKVKDGSFIADMLIELPQDAWKQGPDGKLWPRFTCRHLQPNGDCGAYEFRPQMCREYPYGSPCEYAECTEPSKPDVPMSRFNLKSLGTK